MQGQGSPECLTVSCSNHPTPSRDLNHAVCEWEIGSFRLKNIPSSGFFQSEIPANASKLLSFLRHAWKGINTNWGKNVLAEMIVAAFIFSPSQMAELLTNILQSHHNHFLLFLDLAWELSARPSKSSQITQTFVLPRALEFDHPRGHAPPLVLLDSRKYDGAGLGVVVSGSSSDLILWAFNQ